MALSDKQVADMVAKIQRRASDAAITSRAYPAGSKKRSANVEAAVELYIAADMLAAASKGAA